MAASHLAEYLILAVRGIGVLSLLIVALLFLGRLALQELVLILSKNRFMDEVSQAIDELMEKFPMYPREFMESILMITFKVVTVFTFIGIFICIGLIVAII